MQHLYAIRGLEEGEAAECQVSLSPDRPVLTVKNDKLGLTEQARRSIRYYRLTYMFAPPRIPSMACPAAHPPFIHPPPCPARVCRTTSFTGANLEGVWYVLLSHQSSAG